MHANQKLSWSSWKPSLIFPYQSFFHPVNHGWRQSQCHRKQEEVYDSWWHCIWLRLIRSQINAGHDHYGSINTIYLLLVNTRVMTFYPLTLTLLVLSFPLASRQLSPGLLPISFLLLSNFLGMFIFLQATRCWQSSKTAP